MYFDNHVISHKIFKCHVCGVSFFTMECRATHVKIHPTCDICSETFIEPRHLLSHIKYHKKTPEMDQNHQQLLVHTRGDGCGRTKIYHCKICKENFMDLIDLF